MPLGGGGGRGERELGDAPNGARAGCGETADTGKPPLPPSSPPLPQLPSLQQEGRLKRGPLGLRRARVPTGPPGGWGRQAAVNGVSQRPNSGRRALAPLLLCDLWLVIVTTCSQKRQAVVWVGFAAPVKPGWGGSHASDWERRGELRRHKLIPAGSRALCILPRGASTHTTYFVSRQ